jgi:hypothetical protein
VDDDGKKGVQNRSQSEDDSLDSIFLVEQNKHLLSFDFRLDFLPGRDRQTACLSNFYVLGKQIMYAKSGGKK